jgi:hypothetical protein
LGKSLDAVILAPPPDARCYAHHAGRVDLSGGRSIRKRGAEEMTDNTVVAVLRPGIMGAAMAPN